MSSTQVTRLYVASYNGTITTLSLSHTQNSSPARTSSPYTLTAESTLVTGLQSPSWLTLQKSDSLLYVLDRPKNETPQTPDVKTLYIVDEATSHGLGGIVSYTTHPTLPLQQHHRLEAPQGGCHMIFYNEGRNVATAHYAHSAVLAYSVDAESGHLKLIQTLQFGTDKPGLRKDRQEASHPHQVLLDPSEKYLLVPDLGADLVRVFAIDSATGVLTETAPLVATPGSGPRHAIFAQQSYGRKELLLYLAEELSMKVSAYSVTYADTPGGGMVFKRQKEEAYDNIHGHGKPTTAMTIAEIALSPDSRFLLVSNRGDKLCNGDDSIAVWRRDGDAEGKEVLAFMGLYNAGGLGPRHFEINKRGDLVAVGLQGSGRVVVLEMDVETGVIGGEVARCEGVGEVVCVVWDA